MELVFSCDQKQKGGLPKASRIPGKQPAYDANYSAQTG